MAPEKAVEPPKKTSGKRKHAPKVDSTQKSTPRSKYIPTADFTRKLTPGTRYEKGPSRVVVIEDHVDFGPPKTGFEILSACCVGGILLTFLVIDLWVFGKVEVWTSPILIGLFQLIIIFFVGWAFGSNFSNAILGSFIKTVGKWLNRID